MHVKSNLIAFFLLNKISYHDNPKQIVREEADLWV